MLKTGQERSHTENNYVNDVRQRRFRPFPRRFEKHRNSRLRPEETCVLVPYVRMVAYVNTQYAR